MNPRERQIHEYKLGVQLFRTTGDLASHERSSTDQQVAHDFVSGTRAPWEYNCVCYNPWFTAENVTNLAALRFGTSGFLSVNVDAPPRELTYLDTAFSVLSGG